MAGCTAPLFRASLHPSGEGNTPDRRGLQDRNMPDLVNEVITSLVRRNGGREATVQVVHLCMSHVVHYTVLSDWCPDKRKVFGHDKLKPQSQQWAFRLWSRWPFGNWCKWVILKFKNKLPVVLEYCCCFISLSSARHRVSSSLSQQRLRWSGCCSCLSGVTFSVLAAKSKT